jgi:hypothetical protein
VPVGGEIVAYLGALGMHPSDERLTAVLDLPGATTDTSTEADAEGHVVFRLAARSGGTEFLFAGERLVAVFIGLLPREPWGTYPRPDALIAGLSSGSTRDDARALLGEPAWQSEDADRFREGEDYLQLQYRGERIEVVVAAIGERD